MTRPVVAGCSGAALVMSSVVDDCCLATHGPTDDINNVAPLKPATTGQAMRAQLSQGGHWVRGGWGQAGVGHGGCGRRWMDGPPKKTTLYYMYLCTARAALSPSSQDGLRILPSHNCTSRTFAHSPSVYAGSWAAV